VRSIRERTVRYRHSLNARRAAWRRKQRQRRRRSRRPRRRSARPPSGRRSNSAASGPRPRRQSTTSLNRRHRNVDRVRSLEMIAGSSRRPRASARLRIEAPLGSRETGHRISTLRVPPRGSTSEISPTPSIFLAATTAQGEITAVVVRRRMMGCRVVAPFSERSGLELRLARLAPISRTPASVHHVGEDHGVTRGAGRDDV
jgi:hypothetical protein